MPVAALIGALGGIGSTIIGNSLGKSAENKQYNRTVELMNMQNQQARSNAQWSAVNSKQWEVESLRRAGLSPALANGTGQPMDIGAPSGTAPTPQGANYQNALGGIVNNAMNAYAQNELLSAQKANIQADTAQKEANTQNLSAVTSRIKSFMDEEFKSIQLQNEEFMQRINLINPKQSALLQQQVTDYEMQWKQMQQQWLNLIADRHLTYTQKRNLEAVMSKIPYEIKSLQQEIAESNSRIKLNFAQLPLIDSQVRLNNTSSYLNKMQGSNLQKMGVGLNIENRMKDFEYRIRKSLGPNYYRNVQIVGDVMDQTNRLMQNAAVIYGTYKVIGSKFSNHSAGFTSTLSR